MAKVMIFMDGSWLYSTVRFLGEDFQIDYGKLPVVLAKLLGRKMGGIPVDIVRTYMFGSNAINYQNSDEEMVKRRKVFYDILREEYGYQVEVFPVDYRGRRLRKKDRHPDDDFTPEEKSVDVALSANMLYYAALNSYDIALFLGGSRDYVPLLQKVRLLGKRVAIASIKGSCAFELLDNKDSKHVRDFDVIWLDDLTEDIKAVNEERYVECRSPMHEGPNPILTDEFVRKNRPFFCKECREKMRAQRYSYNDDEFDIENDFDDESFGNRIINAGDVYRGRIKRLMDFFGFIETPEGDFYFGMDDCAHGTDFYSMTEGTPVEFIVVNMPNKRLRGSRGNGKAEEVSVASNDESDFSEE
ncbi:MAG: hypothetical protein CMN32_15320 [Saprospirales bacterium]|nr:hypothetical protein [Saprospirales bacterium]